MNEEQYNDFKDLVIVLERIADSLENIDHEIELIRGEGIVVHTPR